MGLRRFLFATVGRQLAVLAGVRRRGGSARERAVTLGMLALVEGMSGFFSVETLRCFRLHTGSSRDVVVLLVGVLSYL
jgi:hypothetical protein